jgi:Uma2 family endonuclease
MSALIPPGARPATVYPDSDGQPMADNTLQFEWISTLKWNLDTLYRDRPDVFVAGDHLIYPVEDDPNLRQAPDVYVAFGRPRGHRGSYKVWEEDGVFPQVIFEVWSPNNRFAQMLDKLAFYERYGAEEYFIIYPEFPGQVDGWVREGDRLVKLADANGFTSTRTGVRFEITRGQLAVYGPDGRRFLTPLEVAAERDAERQRADAERNRAEKLAEKLRELGVDPDAV